MMLYTAIYGSNSGEGRICHFVSKSFQSKKMQFGVIENGNEYKRRLPMSWKMCPEADNKIIYKSIDKVNFQWINVKTQNYTVMFPLYTVDDVSDYLWNSGATLH